MFAKIALPWQPSWISSICQPSDLFLNVSFRFALWIMSFVFFVCFFANGTNKHTQPRAGTDGKKKANKKAELLTSEPKKEEKKNICWEKYSCTHGEHSPILMSASWSAGTLLNVNGEMSLHMLKAWAMPRCVSLAFIKFVGKETNLLGEQEHCVVNTGLCAHSSTAEKTSKTQLLLLRHKNSHRLCSYSSITETLDSLSFQPRIQLHQYFQ